MLVSNDKGAVEKFIKVRNDNYYLCVVLPSFPNLSGLSLQCSWNLQLLLNKHSNKHKFDCLISNCCDVNQLVEGIEQIILNATQQLAPLKSPVSYSAILSELEVLGASAKIDHQFNNVTLEISDSSSRVHNVIVALPYCYPSKPIVIETHELPLGYSGTIEKLPGFNNVKTLVECYRKLQEFVEIFQQFWDALEVLDSSCWVVEPRIPLLSDHFRRIQIAKHCSVLLTINPYNPHSIPAISFRGPEEEIHGFRETLAKNLMNNVWDPEVDIHLNLLQVLDLESFPENVDCPELGEMLIRTGDCAICFEERFDGSTANQSCDNPRCGSQYHQACLLRYLSSNLNNVRIRNSVMGRCPACRDTIGCLI